MAYMAPPFYISTIHFIIKAKYHACHRRQEARKPIWPLGDFDYKGFQLFFLCRKYFVTELYRYKGEKCLSEVKDKHVICGYMICLWSIIVWKEVIYLHVTGRLTSMAWRTMRIWLISTTKLYLCNDENSPGGSRTAVSYCLLLYLK